MLRSFIIIVNVCLACELLASELDSTFEPRKDRTQVCLRPERPGDYRNEALVLHNFYRTRHSSPPLEISGDLNEYCRKVTIQMAENDRLFDHGQSDGVFGESFYRTNNTKLTDSEVVQQAITEWYDESQFYDYRKPEYSPATEHFTQMIWENTRKLGVGIAHSDGYSYCACAYYPPGNYPGQFPQKPDNPRQW